jgi:hypothetical protein
MEHKNLYLTRGVTKTRGKYFPSSSYQLPKKAFPTGTSSHFEQEIRSFSLFFDNNKRMFLIWERRKGNPHPLNKIQLNFLIKVGFYIWLFPISAALIIFHKTAALRVAGRPVWQQQTAQTADEPTTLCSGCEFRPSECVCNLAVGGGGWAVCCVYLKIERGF